MTKGSARGRTRSWKKPRAGFVGPVKEIESSSGLRVHEAKLGQVSSGFDVLPRATSVKRSV